MDNKNENKNIDENNHVFEVHTMAKDNEFLSQNISNAPKKPLPQAPRSEKKLIPFQKKEAASTPNPFLAKEQAEDARAKKGSFAPQKRTESVEKINYSTEDIAPQKTTPKPPKNPKNIVPVMMIIFIVIFILGAIGFAIYLFVFSKNTEVAEEPVTNLIEDEIVVEKQDVRTQIYSTELPNYFTFDVESDTSANDISQEFQKIERNMKQENISGPISFIVNDINDNPVSFHVFALSSEMSVPQDVLSSLEEDFKIYAYNDPMHGVRFGFAVDVKNINLLQETLTTQETQLPQAFTIIMNGVGIDPAKVVFGDSTYNTHPIRFANLNPAESYSVDYTIYDRKWIMGSTKNTLRAIIDVTKDAAIPDQKSSEFTY